MRRLIYWFRDLFRSPAPQQREVSPFTRTLIEQNNYLRFMLAHEEREKATRRAELSEAITMQGPGPWQAVREGAVNSRESTAIAPLREGIAELELALEDQGWKRMIAWSDVEFSRWGIQQIILICRLFRIKNPLIQRGILVSGFYVFGRGFEIYSEDKAENEVIQEFLDDPRNKQTIGIKSLMELNNALYTDGNIFYAFFHEQNTGKTILRTIDPVEIQEIVTDPDDTSVPRFYRRMWMQSQFDEKTGTTTLISKQAWYVALGYETKARSINGIDVMMDDSGDPVRIYHRKDGGMPKWHFGCPRAYAAIDWARAYKARLEDYATIVRMLSRFSFDVKTKGGAPAIANFKQTFATTLANDGYTLEQNPPPTVGSAFIHTPGTELKAFDGAGKVEPPEEARRLAHMVYMVFGLPETFFSDVSVGTLATATSLDRPTELKFISDQELWSEDFKIIFGEVLRRSAGAPSGRLREARKANPAPQPTQIHVSFPAILEGDISIEVDSIVKAITLGQQGTTGIDLKTGIYQLLMTLDVEDPDVVIEAMFPTSEYDADRTKEEPEPVDPNGEDPGMKKREATLLKAVSQLRQVQEKLEHAFRG